MQGDRHTGTDLPGPVPFMAIDAYARRYGIDDKDEFDRFRFLVAAMDGQLLKWMAAQIADARSPPEPSEPRE